MYGPSSVPLWAGELVVNLEAMKVRPPTAEEIALAKKRKREKKAAVPKDKTASSADPDNLPGGTVEMVPQLPVATATTKSPPRPPAKKVACRSGPLMHGSGRLLYCLGQLMIFQGLPMLSYEF